MQKKNKLLCYLLVFCTLAILFTPSTVQAAVKLNKTSVKIARYHSCQLKVSGTKKKVTWKSSDKDIAEVSKTGKVTAKNEGTAKITATVNKKKYTCKVTVVNYDSKIVLAAYGYKAIQTAIPNPESLKVCEVRVGLNISNVEFAYFQCEYKDKQQKNQTVYVTVYTNKAETLEYYNVQNSFYEDNLIMKFDRFAISPIDKTCSEEGSFEEVKEATKTIFNLEKIKVKKGEHFDDYHSWIEL